MRNEECYGCEFYDECEDQDCLCTGCKHEDDCPLQSVMCMCKKGFYLECNNGYEDEDDWSDDEEDEDEEEEDF